MMLCSSHAYLTLTVNKRKDIFYFQNIIVTSTIKFFKNASTLSQATIFHVN